MADQVRQAGFDQVFQLLQMLQGTAQQAYGMGQNPKPLALTEEDQALANQAFDFTRQAASSQFERGSNDLARAISGAFAERGLSGSTMEAAQAGIAQRGMQDQLFQMLNQSRAEQAQSLLQLPLQRQQVQNQTNATLFDAIIRATQPALDWRGQQLGVGAAFKRPTGADYFNTAAQAVGQIGGQAVGALGRP